MNRIYKISRWLHKFIGLFLIIFLAWMSITGVLLNHPNLIAGFAVPQFLTPDQYVVKNWNRSSLTHMVFSPKDSSQAVICGKLGVFKTKDAGQSFYPMNNGFPTEPFYKKTAHIYLAQKGDSTLLFAGTNNGLYVCDFDREKWHKLDLKTDDPAIKKIIRVDDRLLVFTNSQVFATAFPGSKKLVFREEILAKENDNHKVSLIPLFFHLHSGEIWGLPGKLLYDMVGIILLFLSISAFYSWYFPWKRRREKQRYGKVKPAGMMRRLFKWFLKYHLKLGIWSAVILVIIGFTGLFMRPPLLVLLAGDGIPAAFYPGSYPQNPWHEKINNALYDEFTGQIIIEASDGFWVGDAHLKNEFHRKDLDIPVFVMGTTAFEADSLGYLAGSFNGLFFKHRNSAISLDVITQKHATGVSNFKPAEYMVTGYFETPFNEKYITTHEKGIFKLGSIKEAKKFKMPENIKKAYQMPLWNWLFEIHNGRFFKDWIGTLYILIIPLGAIGFLLISFSGIYDWLFHNSHGLKAKVRVSD